jgi:hypothetical protein
MMRLRRMHSLPKRAAVRSFACHRLNVDRSPSSRKVRSLNRATALAQ